VSTNLKWRPARQTQCDLSDDLKYALRKSRDMSVPLRLDRSHLPYLQGLLHGGIEDAQKLIDAIEKHGEIEVCEYF
jgi:hypothetical protein